MLPAEVGVSTTPRHPADHAHTDEHAHVESPRKRRRGEIGWKRDRSTADGCLEHCDSALERAAKECHLSWLDVQCGRCE